MVKLRRKICFPVHLPVSRAEAFAWHQRPGALARLLPPWENIDVVRRAADINVGSQVEFCTRMGPLPIRWLAEHTACDPPEYFEDVQLRGPFEYWRHQHRFIEDSAEKSTLEDRLEYSLPGGHCGNWFAGQAVGEKIERMFAYRHAVTRADLATHAIYKKCRRLSVGITGADGLVGSALTAFLTTGGHAVTAICRSQRSTAATSQMIWNPGDHRELDESIGKWDAVIHLAGENIARRRWSARQKQEIWNSRVERTRSLCESLASSSNRPDVLLAASAIGFYASSTESTAEILTEDAPRGEGFLAELAAEWEEACRPALEAGIRVVHLRFGTVLSPKGGALASMLPLFRLGLGGKIGDGRQFWSWISVDDVVGAIHHALMEPEIVGPLNLVAPHSVTNAAFVAELARVLRRWAILPLPRRVTEICLGEMAEALLCSSLRVAPQKLIKSGYQFRHAELHLALNHMLGLARASHR